MGMVAKPCNEEAEHENERICVITPRGGVKVKICKFLIMSLLFILPFTGSIRLTRTLRATRAA